MCFCGYRPISYCYQYKHHSLFQPLWLLQCIWRIHINENWLFSEYGMKVIFRFCAAFICHFCHLSFSLALAFCWKLHEGFNQSRRHQFWKNSWDNDCSPIAESVLAGDTWMGSYVFLETVRTSVWWGFLNGKRACLENSTILESTLLKGVCG